MDRCEEDVVIECGLYLLTEEGKSVKRKYWVHNVFCANEQGGEFHTLFGRLKDSFIHSFSILSDDKSKTSSKTMPPYSAMQSLLLHMRISSPVLKVIQ